MGNKSQVKVYNTREAIKILQNNGYRRKTRKGSDHLDFVNETGNKIVITKKINRMVWQRLVKENSLVLS